MIDITTTNYKNTKKINQIKKIFVEIGLCRAE